MTPYNVVLTRTNYPGEYKTILFGKDRDEVITFTKKAYKNSLVKILSTRKVTRGGTDDETVERADMGAAAG
jgi:hypothetical protein